MSVDTSISGSSRLEPWPQRYGASIAIVLVGIAGNASTIIKPMLVGTDVAYFSFTRRAAGYLLAAEMTAAATAILASAVLLAHVRQREFVLVALMLILVGNAGSTVAGTPHALYFWRILTGVGHGLALGPVSASMARMREPDRLAGIMSVAVMGCASAFSFFIPTVQAAIGGDGAGL